MYTVEKEMGKRGTFKIFAMCQVRAFSFALLMNLGKDVNCSCPFGGLREPDVRHCAETGREVSRLFLGYNSTAEKYSALPVSQTLC